MSPTRLLALSALLALAATACESGRRQDGGRREADGGGARPSTDPVEVFSWWNRTGSSDPLATLVAVHRKRHPGDAIINASAQVSGQARATLRARLLRAEPPDLFQANVGADLMQWVTINGLDARESLIAPLDDVLPGVVAEWRRVFPAWLLDEMSYDGSLYGVPSDLHRLNTLFYNKAIFARFGLSEPTSIDDIKAIGRKLKKAGIDPIAIGTKDPWTLALLAFECVLVSQQGADFYSDYFVGNARADDPRVRRALDTALELRDYINADHAQLFWLQAVEHVINGRAAMTVIGDWAEPAFEAHGLKIGQDYAEIPFPGTAQSFIFTSDAFALPVGAKNAAGAARMLETIGSAEGQRAVARIKGAVPPRQDVTGDFPPHAAAKLAVLQTGKIALAQSGMVPPSFARDLNAALAEMFEQHDVEPVLHTLRSRYPLLWRRNGWGHARHVRGAR